MTVVQPTRKLWLTLAVLVAIALCYSAAAQVANSIDYKTEYSDFFPFWLAGNLVAHGQNPYAADPWNDGYAQNNVGPIIDHAFLYPLPLALLFVPFGLLPLRLAQTIWGTITLLVILGTALFLALPRTDPQAKKLILPLLIGVLFFRPAVLSLVTGHISALFLFLITASFFFFEREKPIWGGFLLAFLILKPNIGAPLLLLLSVWLLREKKFKAFAGMAAAGITLLLAGLLINHQWVVEYLQVGAGKLSQAFGFSPTVWGLSFLICGYRTGCTLIAGGIAAVLVGLLTLWLLTRRRQELTTIQAFSLSITTTLLITPYTWTYDQLMLLLPIAAIMFSLSERKKGFLPAALLFLAIDLLCIVLLIFNTLMNKEILNVFIPLTVLLLLLWTGLRIGQLAESKKSSS